VPQVSEAALGFQSSKVGFRYQVHWSSQGFGNPERISSLSKQKVNKRHLETLFDARWHGGKIKIIAVMKQTTRPGMNSSVGLKTSEFYSRQIFNFLQWNFFMRNPKLIISTVNSTIWKKIRSPIVWLMMFSISLASL
jgi:hypothetical protein